MNNINDRHPLGKGEVESSILSGSTEYARQIEAFRKSPDTQSAAIGGTEREDDASTRGESVDSVHALARKLSAWATPLPMDICCPSLVLATSLKNWAKDPTETRINAQVRKNYRAWLEALNREDF